MEFKRVIKDKKLLLLIVFALIANTAVFVRSLPEKGELEQRAVLSNQYMQLDTKAAYSAYKSDIAEADTITALLYYMSLKTENPEEYEEYCREHHEALASSFPSLAEKVSKWEESDIRSFSNRHEALKVIGNRLEYIEKYGDKLKEIKGNADLMSTIVLLSSDYAKSDIEKTVSDYEKISDLNPIFFECSAAELFFGYDMSRYFALAISILSAFLFTSEKRKGLYEAVRSTPNGRSRLAAVRTLTLLFISVASALLLNILIFAVSAFACNGTGILSAPVQSLPSFSELTYNITLLGILSADTLLAGLTAFIAGMVIWILLSIFKNDKNASALFVLIVAAELVPYKLLRPQNPLAIFKYFNLCAAANVRRESLTYLNIPLFSHPVGKNAAILTFIFLMILLTVPIALLIGKTGSAVYGRGTDGAMAKLMRQIRRLTARGGIASKELKKLFLHQNGIFWLCVLMAFSIYITDFEAPGYSASETLVNDMYETCGGSSYQSVYEYVKTREEEISIKGEEYGSGLIEELRKGCAIATKYADHLKAMNEHRGIPARVINQRAYEHLFGKKYRESYSFYDTLALSFVILILFDIYRYERKNNMTVQLRTSAKGRRGLLRAKLNSALVASFSVWLIVCGFELFGTAKIYGIGGVDYPVQSIMALSGIDLKITLGSFMILTYLMKLILIISAAFIFICGSSMFGSIKGSAIIALLFLLPDAAGRIGLPGIDRMSFAALMFNPLERLLIPLIVISCTCALTVYRYKGAEHGSYA